jgi:hypothetical protein
MNSARSRKVSRLVSNTPAHTWSCISPRGRGLHSSTFRLNVSTFCGIGGAFEGCLGGIQVVSRGV